MRFRGGVRKAELPKGGEAYDDNHYYLFVALWIIKFKTSGNMVVSCVETRQEHQKISPFLVGAGLFFN